MSDGAAHGKARYAVAFVAVALLAVLAYALGGRDAPPPRASNGTLEPASVGVEAAPDEAPPALETAPAPLVAPSANAAVPVRTTEIDEGELMRRLRLVRGRDARVALELAREGNRRFASSSDAPERASILIHSLAELGFASQARGEAEDMVNRYPDSAWVREVENFTGAHRHRNVRVDEEGRLSFIDPPPPR